MKVIVASFPKCGTKTLTKCLTILGYNVYDFEENFFYLEKEWRDILNHGPSVEAFRKMYRDVDAVTDIPACCYWETILQAFPQAKVILTTRNSEEEWLKSWDAQIRALETNIKFQIRSAFTPTGWRFCSFERLKGRVLFDCPPQKFNQFLAQPDPEIKKKKYRDHNEAVLKNVPKDKLLVFKFSEGWKPLCDFLGKDIPDTPFPHANKGAQVGAQLVFRKLDEELYIICACGIVFVALFLLYLS